TTTADKTVITNSNEFKINKATLLFREYVYNWTSTCGTKYQTTFGDGWTPTQMANYIADYNQVQCGGVRPYVSLELAPGML
ncbi:MAG: hypothetical protein KBS61_04410, partial [Chryseobacterium sp.]|nr:hypothetical protein [Candidatus Chryseobacterium enterohippi]